MRKLTAGLFAALFALAGSACGEEGGGGGAAGVNALAAAAENATDAGSSAVTMTMSINAGGQEMSIDAEGAFDFDDQIGEMTMTMEGAGLPEALEIDMIVEDQYAYMKMPAELGMGEGWFRMDMSSMPGVGANGANQFSQDPSQYLDFLHGASDGEIEEVGTDDVDGVSTTHYKAELSFDKILEQAPDQEAAEELEAQLDSLGGDFDSIPSEVWIDEDGLPRRMTISMEFDAGGQDGDMDISMDFFDYGIDVDVEPPKDFEELPAAGG